MSDHTIFDALASERRFLETRASLRESLMGEMARQWGESFTDAALHKWIDSAS